MRADKFSRVLNALEQRGFAKKPIKIMEDRATQVVKEGDSLNQDGFGDFYANFWGTRIPEEVKEELFRNYDECEGCQSPLLDDEVQGYRGKYCTDDCREEYEEYVRQCYACGDTYDSENEGGWLFDNDYCSSECAWEAIRSDIRHMAQNEGYDPDETLEAIERESDMAPWYDSERQMLSDIRRYGVQFEECDQCGSDANPEEMHEIYDIHNNHYCDDECAWEAIKDYAKDNDLSDEQIAKLVENNSISDLSGAGDLDTAIDELKYESEYESEEESEED